VLEKCVSSDSFVSVMFHCSVYVELQCRELLCLTLGCGSGFVVLQTPESLVSFFLP
jgi:hypothetical protein